MSAEANGADAICAALRAAGVDTVFGVPGTQTVALYEALRRSGLRTLTATDERAATFMAQGYFRASGRLAAVSAIPGPGFAFALSALPEAYLDSTAVVLLTGQPPICDLGRRRAQSIGQAAMASPVVKAVIDVDEPDQVAAAVRTACAQAVLGEPGPVLVQVAQSVYGQSASAPTSSLPNGLGDQTTDDGSVREAAAFCASADRVLFYVGQGAADASEALHRVVAALGALAATTPSGRGVLREDWERVLPLDATGDAEAFNSIAAQCDAIVVLGAALSENGTVGFGLDFPEERLVRVDRSPSVLAAAPRARFAVQASSRAFIDALEAVLAARRPRSAEQGLRRASRRACARDSATAGSVARRRRASAAAFRRNSSRRCGARSLLKAASSSTRGCTSFSRAGTFRYSVCADFCFPRTFSRRRSGCPRQSGPRWRSRSAPSSP